MGFMPPKKKPQKKGGLNHSFIILLFFILSALLIPGAVWVFHKRSEERQEQFLTRRLEKLGEFRTITQRYRSVFYVREKKNFIQDKSVLFTADFNVQAGVDLSEGFDLQLKRGQVLVTLPRGRIFLVDADDSTIEEVMIREQFSTINTGDYLPLINEESEKIRHQALASGITETAEERAALLLRGILRSAGIEDADIRFRRGDSIMTSSVSEEDI